jgi:hypothetical protein
MMTRYDQIALTINESLIMLQNILNLGLCEEVFDNANRYTYGWVIVGVM